MCWSGKGLLGNLGPDDKRFLADSLSDLLVVWGKPRLQGANQSAVTEAGVSGHIT